MKILLISTPARTAPSGFPPVGCLSLMSYLRKHGYEDVRFFNIDAERPAYRDVLARIVREKPGVLGISAVVSTSYDYTKAVIADIKRMLPDTLVVVGGNLAASAEILLKKAGADICVLGEGEEVLLSIVRQAEESKGAGAFSGIPGLAYLDASGAMVNTGYAGPIPIEHIYNADLREITSDATIDLYFPPAFSGGNATRWFRRDPRAWEPHRRDKRDGMLSVGKGCVARCTFCHRWDRGIRHIPVDLIMQRLDVLVKQYNVGFLNMAIESFGIDRNWLKEFCAKIKPYDIIWRAAGVRANSVTLESIAMMKDAGCSCLQFGHESGSRRMLEVMEKKLKLEDNYNSLRWTVEAGLWTLCQFVISMPGENRETIMETADFGKYAMSLARWENPMDTSINYAQALPGSPLYEYGRHNGIIGADMEAEERYLEFVSDTNAANAYKSLNFTDSTELERLSWRMRIRVEIVSAYVEKYGWPHLRKILLMDNGKIPYDKDYFTDPDHPLVPAIIEESRQKVEKDGARPAWADLKLAYQLLIMARFKFLITAWTFLGIIRNRGLFKGLATLRGNPAKKLDKYISLRKVLNDEYPPLPQDSSAMMPLRKGR